MDESQIKTSLWQRIVIIIVALLLLGSTILAYLFIVMSGNGSQSREERIAELQEQLNAKNSELEAAAKPFSDQYFSTMDGYRKSQVKSYNATTANNEKLKVTDLKTGTGKQLEEGDTDYSAYYIGWCPDGSIFDATFTYADDDTDKQTPTGLTAPLVASTSLIEGWTQGMIGMKLGGVRQINIPGELAYGDTSEEDQICGMNNAPLRFVVMPVETDENLKQLGSEISDLRIKLYTALLGNQ